MSEREYQQRMLESKCNLVFCDWDSGKGKTYAIARDIVSKIDANAKKIVIVTRNIRLMSDIIQNDLQKLTKYNVVGRGFEKIIITDINKRALIDITIVGTVIDSIRGMKFDYIYCDEYIPSSNEMDMFGASLVNQVYVLGTFEIDYISDREIDISENDWIEQEIKKLMQEFSRIPNSENTTKRREVVLGMIRELKQLKNYSNIE